MYIALGILALVAVYLVVIYNGLVKAAASGRSKGR